MEAENETEIKPALTPEEWEFVHSVGFPNICIDVRARYGTHLFYQGPPAGLRDHARGNPDVHRVVALALYRQPFGFTREDVDRLRSWVATIEDIYGPTAVEHAMNLADRIAALLPPRDVDTTPEDFVH